MLERTPRQQWWTARELLEVQPRGLPSTKSNLATYLLTIRSKADRQGRPLSRKRVGRGGGWEYHYTAFPYLAQNELIAHYHRELAKAAKAEDNPAEKPQPGASQERKDQWALFEAAPKKNKDKARDRLAVIHAFEVYRERGVPHRVAELFIVKEFKVSKSAINAWRKLVAGMERHDWLAYLIPQYKGRTATAECSPEAWDAYKTDYLRLEKPPHSACYDRLKVMAKEHGWTIPSARAFVRRIDREVSKMLLTLMREGDKAASKLYPAQKRIRTDMVALEGVNADGHTLDVWVKWHDGEVIRPVATVVADLYSNKVLSYRIDKSESATAVRLAFYDVFRNYGIPDRATLDNGRAFASKQITGGQPTRYRFKVTPDEAQGVLTALGIKVHWATPGHGQAKPIERIFRSFCDHIAKAPQFAGAYAGNSPTNKPAYNHDPRDKAVDFDTFMQVFEAGVNAFNAREGRRTGVCAGRLSYDQAFANSYAENPIRKATEEQLRMAMLSATRVTALAPSGELQLLENRYWAEFLGGHIGERLNLRFDPENLHSGVYVYNANDEYLGEAAVKKDVGFHSVEAARVHNKQRREYVRALKEAAKIEVSMSVKEFVQLMPEAGEPAPVVETKTVRMFKPSGAATAAKPVVEEEEAEAPQGIDFDAMDRGLRLIKRDDEDF